jgi:hypothetical protein
MNLFSRSGPLVGAGSYTCGRRVRIPPRSLLRREDLATCGASAYGRHRRRERCGLRDSDPPSLHWHDKGRARWHGAGGSRASVVKQAAEEVSAWTESFPEVRFCTTPKSETNPSTLVGAPSLKSETWGTFAFGQVPGEGLVQLALAGVDLRVRRVLFVAFLIGDLLLVVEDEMVDGELRIKGAPQ